jgi:hypothetical protein
MMSTLSVVNAQPVSAPNPTPAPQHMAAIHQSLRFKLDLSIVDLHLQRFPASAATSSADRARDVDNECSPPRKCRSVTVEVTSAARCYRFGNDATVNQS